MSLAVQALFDHWADAATNDAVLRKFSLGLRLEILFSAATAEFRLSLLDGSVHCSRGKSQASEPDVSISADDRAWDEFFSMSPVLPGWQSFGAITRGNARFQVAGDTLAIAQGLAGLERVFELARPMPRSRAPECKRDISLLTGHYRAIPQGNGKDIITYWDESGAGIPVVMLHTAGADSRQYSYQLSDVDMAARFHMFAFDLEGHGRSQYPADFYSASNYVLTLDGYLAQCAAFIETVVGGPAIIVGCSMGAAMSLVLAARRPDLVTGVLALEAPWRAPGRFSNVLAHGQVNAGLHNPSYVRALLSPYSPQVTRDEACWIYGQGAFGIYAGDLRFYSDEFDGELVGKELEDTRIPIRLLTGEYDYSASPGNTRKIAQLIKGSSFREMSALGHFPMIEDPNAFREYFVRELDAIVASMDPKS